MALVPSLSYPLHGHSPDCSIVPIYGTPKMQYERALHLWAEGLMYEPVYIERCVEHCPVSVRIRARGREIAQRLGWDSRRQETE